MPSFNLVGLDTVVNLTENVEYPDYVPPDISASYFMHLYEAPELINEIFNFKTTDPELTSSTADNDMSFKCEPTKWPNLTFSEGVKSDTKQDIRTIPFQKDIVKMTKNIGVRWLAKKYYRWRINSDVFADESELQTQYQTLDISKPNDFGSHPPFKYSRLAIDITQPTKPETPAWTQLGYMQIFRILAYDETGYLPVVSSSVSRFWGGANGTNVLSNLFQGEEIDFNGGTDYSGVGRMGADFGWTQFFNYSGGGEFLTNGLGGEYVEWEYASPKKLTELRMLLGGVWGWSTRVILFGTNDATIASGNENWTQLGNPWNS